MARNLTPQEQIWSIAKSRGVEFLCHFTQAANLANIVEHGLRCRRELIDTDYLAHVSDLHRLDDNDNAISVSVSMWNGGMLDIKRYKNPGAEWVVLVLNAEILWTHQCLFCWQSAATKSIKEHRGYRGGPWAFDKMFGGTEADRSGLADNQPTDNDAEVQVLEAISPAYILGAVVDRFEMVEPVQLILNNLPEGPRAVQVDPF